VIATCDRQVRGREWRSTIDEMIERERSAMGGLGPFERDWLITKRSPERVQSLLRKAAEVAKGEMPDVLGVNSPFAAPVGTPGGPPSSFTAVGTTNVETNLWTPAIWSPIPALDMQAGKFYKVEFGGILSTSSAAPTSVWTPRCGQSATPASNITLGATTGSTMIASLASVPFYGTFVLQIRALGLAASGASGTGNGFVCIGGLTTALGVIQVMGATVATTMDNTTATGLIISQTWGTNAAANTLTCQWVTPSRSYN
jgi:hypothetical protein